MRPITEITCAACRGTGLLQIVTTEDVMERGREIIEEVASAHHLSIAEIIGPSRHRQLVTARNDAAKRLRAETTLTLKAIGLILGRRDHSTVMHMLNGDK